MQVNTMLQGRATKLQPPFGYYSEASWQPLWSKWLILSTIVPVRVGTAFRNGFGAVGAVARPISPMPHPRRQEPSMRARSPRVPASLSI